jgi:DUF1016 N-terminal domain
MKNTPKRPNSNPEAHYESILGDISNVIIAVRRSAARSVNCIMTAAYWLIGRRIVESEQAGSIRAEYGQALIEKLSGDLTAKFGRGFGAVNLSQMKKFYLVWPAERPFQTPFEKSRVLPGPPGHQTILQTLSEKSQLSPAEVVLGSAAECFPLPWSAYVRLLLLKNENALRFYETEALRGGWSVRQLDRQINSQLYERTALSGNKTALLSKGLEALPKDLASRPASLPVATSS